MRKLKAMKLGDAFHSLTRPTLTLPPEASLGDALGIMADQRATAIVIIKGDQIQGIVSRGDILRQMNTASQEARVKHIPLQQIMTTELIMTEPGQSLQNAIGHMDAAGIAHLPVVQQGRFLYLLHREDLLGRQVQLLHDQIDYLQQYIDHLHNAEMD